MIILSISLVVVLLVVLFVWFKKQSGPSYLDFGKIDSMMPKTPANKQDCIGHEVPEIIIRATKDHGYDSAQYLGKWFLYEAYKPFSDTPMIIGYPVIFLLRGKKIRIPRDPLERLAIMRYFRRDEDLEEDNDPEEEE